MKQTRQERELKDPPSISLSLPIVFHSHYLEFRPPLDYLCLDTVESQQLNSVWFWSPLMALGVLLMGKAAVFQMVLLGWA